MTKLDGLLAPVVIIGVLVCPVVAAGQALAQPASEPIVVASLSLGSIEGVVTDERGTPLAGVAVVAQGRQLLFAVTDEGGRFSFEGVRPGPYLLSAQSPGFVASKQNIVDVLPHAAAWRPLRLERVSSALVLAAGPGPSDTTAPANPTGGDNHSAAAWRIRHLKQSVLRDVMGGVAGDVGELGETPGGALPGLPATADLQSSLLAGLQLAGHVQLLTAGAFDRPEELLSALRAPNQVTYMALGSLPSSPFRWEAHGAFAQGDLASWILGGSVETRVAEHHALNAGVSYGTQRLTRRRPSS